MRLQRYRILSILLPLVLVLLAAHLLPADAIDRFPLLGRIADSYAAWFPYMGEYAAASTRPQLTYVMLALSLPLSVPVGLSYPWWRQLFIDQDRGGKFFSFRVWGWIALLSLAYPLVLPGPIFHGHGAGTDWIITHTRTGLGLYCCMLLFIEAAMMMISLDWWRVVRIPQHIRSRNFRGD